MAGADLGKAYVNIVPKAPNISNNISNLLSGGGGPEKAGQSIGRKLVGTLAKVGIGAAVGSMMKQAFEAGGNLQQSFGGLETIYGDAAAAAKEYAQAAAEAGISANSYAEQAVSFGASLKAAYGGDTQKAMEAANSAIMDMADNAAKMGTPLESIQTAYQGFAKQNYTMLDNLKLGYGGTKQEMERLLKDAQKISGVEYNIDNLGDIYSAIHVIQGELGLTGVAAAEAQTTFTGSLGAVTASWENVMGAMTTGQGLDTAMEGLKTSIGNFATVAVQMFSELATQLPELILGLVDVVIENAPSFIAAGAELILKLVTGLVGKIPDLVAKIPEIFTSFSEAWGNIDWKTLGDTLINMIGDQLVSLKETLAEKATDLGDSLKTKWEEFDFKAFGEHLIDKVKEGVTEFGKRIWDGVKSVIDDAKEKALKIDWSDLGSSLVNGIKNGLWNGATSLYRAVRSLISNALGAGEEEAEVGSPSKLFARELGRWIPLGIAEGITEESGAVESAVGDAIAGASGRINTTANITPASPRQSDADRIIDALSRMKFQSDVHLEGDARELFRMIRGENNSMARATAYNALGGLV